MWKAFVEVTTFAEPLWRQTRDDFYPKESIHPDTMSGLDGVMADGVAYKLMSGVLTREQLSELIVQPLR
jgi:NitT/TauT family transport system substrate-binding protein